MRAPVQKKRPRSKGSKRSGSGVTPPAPAENEGTRRTVRVRSRLVAGVAVVGITVIAAGAPAALSASSDLNDSQRLVTLAELNQQAIALAHALADERDEVTAYIAAGRDEKSGPTAEGKGDPGSRSARVDQRVDEIRVRPRPHCAAISPPFPPCAATRSAARAPRWRPIRRTPRSSPSSTISPTSSPRRPRRGPPSPPAPRSPSARPPSRPPPPAGCWSPRCPYPARSRPRSSTRSPGCPSRPRTWAAARTTAPGTS